MKENDKRLKMMLPGGELEKSTTLYLRTIGLEFEGQDRRYFIPVQNMPIDLAIMRASSIPDVVSDQRSTAAAGITGSDILWEAGWGKAGGEEIVIPNAPRSSLYVGFSDKFITNFNNKNGRLPELGDLKGAIATKYPNITREYLGLKPEDILFAPGKDEAYTYLYESVNGVLGIWSSGATAKANGLQPVDFFYEVSTRFVTACSDKLAPWELNILNDFREKCYVARKATE